MEQSYRGMKYRRNSIRREDVEQELMIRDEVNFNNGFWREQERTDFNKQARKTVKAF